MHFSRQPNLARKILFFFPNLVKFIFIILVCIFLIVTWNDNRHERVGSPPSITTSSRRTRSFAVTSSKTIKSAIINIANDEEETPKTSTVVKKSSEQDFNTDHALPGTYNLMVDAAPHNGGMRRPTKKCSLEYMNDERLQQDHPCVINNIKEHFLVPPAPRNVPYELDYPEVIDPSDGQTRTVLHLLRNKTNGFFIECGALDGENISNTLYMERFLNWTGLLVEADQESFKYLRSRKRKSWSAPVCLSSSPYPQKLTFRVSYAIGHIIDANEPVKNFSGKTSAYGKNVETQCFPLYSLLVALGQKEVDYFSLDIEGYEPYILRTIPFHLLNISVLSVEWITARTTEDRPRLRKEIVDIMTSQDYVPLESRIYGADVFFVKKGHPVLNQIYDDDPLIKEYELLN